jgi:hypothetical protein
LFQFALSESTDGKCVPSGRRLNTVFVFYLEGRGQDGARQRRVIFGYVKEWDSVGLYMNSAKALLDTDDYAEFYSRMNRLFNDEVGPNTKAATISPRRVEENLGEFLKAMRWLKSRVVS